MNSLSTLDIKVIVLISMYIREVVSEVAPHCSLFKDVGVVVDNLGCESPS